MWNKREWWKRKIAATQRNEQANFTLTRSTDNNMRYAQLWNIFFFRTQQKVKSSEKLQKMNKRKREKRGKELKWTSQAHSFLSFICKVFLHSFAKGICGRSAALSQVNFDSIIFPISLKHANLIETKRVDGKKDWISVRRTKKNFIFSTTAGSHLQQNQRTRTNTLYYMCYTYSYRGTEESRFWLEFCFFVVAW